MWLALGITTAASGAVALIVANAESDRAKAIIKREGKRARVGQKVFERGVRERGSLAARGCPPEPLRESQRQAEQRLSSLFADARRRVHNLED
jgi:hypothetical protein